MSFLTSRTQPEGRHLFLQSPASTSLNPFLSACEASKSQSPSDLTQVETGIWLRPNLLAFATPFAILPLSFLLQLCFSEQGFLFQLLTICLQQFYAVIPHRCEHIEPSAVHAHPTCYSRQRKVKSHAPHR